MSQTPLHGQAPRGVEPPKAVQPSTHQQKAAESALPSSGTTSVDWRNLGFVGAVHLLAIGGLIVYLLTQPLTLSACLIGLIGTVLTVFAISAGYHRLFSHQAYETGRVFRWLLLVVGAAAFQTSALTWAATHRRHHRHVDTHLDPYNAKRGFWYSHIGWVLERVHEPLRPKAVDLESCPLVRWQHRFAIPIGVASGFLVPGLIGLLLGDIWGGLLFGGLLRLVVTYHLTFSINSLVHMFGTQPYCERNTSRDSHFAALLTMGEGYHNYHHTFPADYRNGVRPYHFDPTKWVLRSLEYLGITRNLKRTPPHVVARVRLRMDEQRMAREGIPATWSERIERASLALNHTLSEWSALYRQRRLTAQAMAMETSSEARRNLDDQLRRMRRTFRHRYREWQTLLRQMDSERPLAAAS